MKKEMIEPAIVHRSAPNQIIIGGYSNFPGVEGLSMDGYGVL